MIPATIRWLIIEEYQWVTDAVAALPKLAKLHGATPNDLRVRTDPGGTGFVVELRKVLF